MRITKTFAVAASVAALALAFAGCAGPAAPSAPASSAAAVDYKLVTPGALTVCSDVPYAPFEMEDAAAPSGYTGFDIEIMNSVATKLGLTLKVKAIGFDPIKSGTALAAGQCDVAASALSISEERRKNIDFSDPYYDSLQSLLVKSASGITNLAGLAGKNVGVQAGTTGKDYAVANAPKDAKLIDFDNDGLLWSAIQAGKIDAILQDYPVNWVHQQADSNYKIAETYKTDEQYGFGFAKGKSPALVEAVNAQLTAMKADGSYDTLYKKYFS
ncbi:transporter substrate-binding domain-containing protein [Propionicimonas sp.]|uniref:transporter substrate-binding domain-containing protein n=1 Tax=Propionicimonas sp. TaxID=1955623 RepID=UPI00180D0B32|nr:transporter substrate-binding domain-containing protein [Propionicimonas sp.]MBU3976173.1 transporter substrate-binding domain-containing protein [Actinomycetota bacterium]MBA3020985.1 transporter substrate-binding domain-containing protein [Propionicimonas sp.]MBU3985568.1 transporter substrate-binding domain-containing protein [Actinomycetota bacterium]MBU4008353.1 transporter substrate-binding domain-containing protein [Actinomycetota bacterium]MBU4066497.1 transporter substrate-binding 